MKSLGEALPNIVDTVIEPGKNSLICSDGLGTTVSNAIIRQPNSQLTPETVEDILSKLSLRKLWQTRPTTPQDAMPDLQLLEYAMIPATNNQAAFQFGKLLAHFPRRDVTKDAIIISDLSAASVSENLSLVAIARSCSDIWKATTNENPFLPPTGQILRDAREQTERYRQQYDRLKNPKVALPPPESKKEEPPKYGADSWPEMSEENRQKLISDLKLMMPTLRRILRKSYCVPEHIEINPDPEETIIDKNISMD